MRNTNFDNRLAVLTRTLCCFTPLHWALNTAAEEVTARVMRKNKQITGVYVQYVLSGSAFELLKGIINVFYLEIPENLQYGKATITFAKASHDTSTCPLLC